MSIDTFWVQDINGDGIADLVALSAPNLLVWYGLGDFQFAARGVVFPALSRTGKLTLSIDDEFHFIDVNHDGLVDLLILFDGLSPLILINRGDAFVAHVSPALHQLAGQAFGGLHFGDFSGSGNLEVVASRGSKALALTLDFPQTGLLTQMNDGKGTVVHLTYARAPAEPGVYRRATVLESIRLESAGLEPVTTMFTYEGGKVHSVNRQLIGFQHVSMQRDRLREDFTFHNDDTVSSLPIQSVHFDSVLQHFSKQTDIVYSLDTFQGLPYQRQISKQASLHDTNSGQHQESREVISQWANPWCPTQVTQHSDAGSWSRQMTLSNVKVLGNLPHCLISEEVQSGEHSNSSLDFHYAMRLDRDKFGSVTQIGFAGQSPLVLQKITYNDRRQISTIETPGKGKHHYHYDDFTGQCSEVIDPDGVRTKLIDRDPISDAVLALARDHGAASIHHQAFAFDGMERLVERWETPLTGADLALETLQYHFAKQDQPGIINSLVRLEGDRSSRETASISGGDGTVISTALRSPDGWVLAGFERVWPQEGRTISYLQRFLGQHAGVHALLINFSSVYDGALSVQSSVQDALGYLQTIHQQIQEGVTNSVTNNYAVRDGMLVITSEDSQGHVTHRQLNFAGKPVALTDASGLTTTFQYDVAGRLHGLTLPNGDRHAVEYDDAGRLMKIQRDRVGSVVYSYIPGTELISHMAVNNARHVATRTVKYQYDGIGRKEYEIYEHTNGERQRFSYYYDGNWPDGTFVAGQKGFTTGVVGEGFEKSFQYLPNGALKQKIWKLTGWRQITTDFTYFDDGSPRGSFTKVSTKDGRLLSQLDTRTDLDTYGRPISYIVGGNELYHMYYDDLSQVASIALETKGRAIFSRDKSTLRLKSYSLVDTDQFSDTTMSWSRDSQNHIVKESVSSGGTQRDRTYMYDKRMFLASWQEGTSNHTFSYDDNGVPNEKPRSEIVIDSEGRITRRGSKTFQYNAAGHLKKVLCRGKPTIDYLYDESGQRVLKLIGGKPVLAFVDDDTLDAESYVRMVEVQGWRLGILNNGKFSPVFADSRNTVLV